MPYGTINLGPLAQRFDDAGIPISGLSYDGTTVTANYLPQATAAQQSQGAALIAGFTVATVYERKFSDILVDISTLAANDPTSYAKVVRWTVTRVLQLDPILVKVINAALGLSIATTTTDPAHAEQ